MSKELRRCPFCGGEAKLWSGNIDDDYWDIYYDVYCTACNCMTPKFHTEESAITFWNRRKPLEDIVERLKESDEIIRVFPKLQPNLTPFCEHPYHLPKPKPVSLKPIECIPLTEAIKIMKGGAV